uniref:hypothetical protein n=1 Tax=Microbulbifer agarilyticus TaxID=260552 RepID=UPI000492CDB0|nr:hypothetical protein [Microbulbifer agarilyticus]
MKEPRYWRGFFVCGLLGLVVFSFKASLVAGRHRVLLFETAVNPSMGAAAATSLSPTLSKNSTRHLPFAATPVLRLPIGKENPDG